LFCLKCREKKVKIENEYRNIKKESKYYKDINKFENELNKNMDKLEFMDQLYGKGILDIGPVEDIKEDNIKINK
jgi:hypothetical protein